MDKHMITQQGLLQTQVCSSGTWDEALRWLQFTSPAGTTNNWQKDERPEVAPVQCADCTDRNHFIFVC